jgi:short-subunit dehydrogenase
MNQLTKAAIVKRPLNQKVVVITGASSGVGLAAALEFAAKGATLVLAARREQALADVVQECETLGGKAIAVPTDITDADAVKSLAAAAIDFGGRIDVWINNAGVLAAGEFSKTPVEIHDRVIEINLKGYVHGAYAVMPYFMRQKYGVLINNISVGGWIPTPYAVGYTASKYGLRGYSEALKGELINWPDIHVCDLYPAFLDTPGIQHAANYTDVELKPAPPVFDPQRVAKAMVKLSQYPRSVSCPDLFAPFLKLSYSLFPRLFRTIESTIIGKYIRNAEPIASTSGNVLDPVNYGSSVHGGWRSVNQKPKTALKSALVLAGVAIILGRFAFRK